MEKREKEMKERLGMSEKEGERKLTQRYLN